MSRHTEYPGQERRDQTPKGRARRAAFQASLELLAALGLSPDAIEYYRRQARKQRVLPHHLVREIVEERVQLELAIVRIGVDTGRPT